METATIGEMIRRKRRNQGLNQEDVGEVFGINQSSVAKWERGARPAPVHLPKIAEFLQLPLAEVLSIYHGSTDASFEESIEEIRLTVASTDRRLSELLHLAQELLEQVQAMMPTPAPASAGQHAAQAPQRRRRVVRTAR